MMNKPLEIRLGKGFAANFNNYQKYAKLFVHQTGWTRTLILGESGGGKSALAKDAVVRLSKYRRMVVFSLRGEWEKHCTEFSSNIHAEKYKMDDVKIISRYSVKLTDFTEKRDFISLGFSVNSSAIMELLISKGYRYHQNDVDKFKEMLRFFPTKQYEYIKNGKEKIKVDLVQEYKNAYGVEIDTKTYDMTSVNLISQFRDIEDWIWREGGLPYVDFAEEFKKNRHLIINIGEDKQKAMCLCGLVMRKLRNVDIRMKPVFVFEELSILCPDKYDSIPDKDIPSSIYEIRDILKTGRKEFIGFIGIVQHHTQIDKECLNHIFSFIFVGRYDMFSGEIGELAKSLKWIPLARGGKGIREALLYNKDGTWVKFLPNECCCRC